MHRIAATMIACAALACSAAAEPGPSMESAASAIREFEGYCGKGAVIWGKPLCGALIVVDPVSRTAIANARPGPGFVERAGLWTGTLPNDAGLANSSVELDGNMFAEIILPLPADAENRRVLMAHESFHRIQPALGFKAQEADNSHLDTRDGRIWARLEMAALRAALTSRDWQPAARDALAFRAKRLALFPGAETAEARLIANEGLAEYTGVTVGAGKNAAAFAVKRLDSGADRQSLIRSFGYVVGPAYGLLLDRISPNWRAAALTGKSLPGLLEQALPPGVRPTSADYGEATIVAQENARDARIQERRRTLLATLIDGPTVTFPASGMNVFFDPNTLFSLGPLGTVYSRATEVKADWGTLKASGDLLLSPGWTYARVQGPAKLDGRTLVGPDWTAELAAGYSIVPDQRAGSFILQKQ
jgi:hypothetical protein